MAHNPGKPSRPLSPHLQIYKWGPHMLVSIMHRITGDGMALVGMPLLLWWLYAIAAGPEAYAYFFTWFDWLYIGYIVMIGMTFAFFEHLYSGLRHFVLDAGAGYELKTNKLWSTLIPMAAIFSTIAVWLYIAFKNI